MVSGNSPEWLPPGFTQKVKYRNGRRIKYYINNTTGTKYYSKKDVIQSAAAENDLLGIPQTTKGGDKLVHSSKTDDVVVDQTNDSLGWLPDGWIVEEKLRKSGSSKGSVYKVYIESSSGNKFYSRAAVTRYLDTVGHSTTLTTKNKVDDVDKPCKDTPQSISQTVTTNISGKKRKGGSFKMVAAETTADEDLPPGWIKEIRTSKSGHKIRRDPLYIDPSSGYMFRSKKDMLRYLETNDIESCRCRPLIRESDDLKIMNEIPSSNTGNDKLFNHKGQLFLEEKSNCGGEASGAKSVPGSEAEILKQAQDSNVLGCVEDSVGASSHVESILDKNSPKYAEMESNPERANEESSKEELKNVEFSVTDPVLTKQQHSENRIEKPDADKTRQGSRKSKRTKDSSLPLRTSKRLARAEQGEREPEMLPDLNLSERSIQASVRKKSSGSGSMQSSGIHLQPDGRKVAISLPPDNEPAKEITEPVPTSKETLTETEPVEKETVAKERTEPVPTSKDTLTEAEPLEKETVANDPTTGAIGMGGEKSLDDGRKLQEPLFRYKFGESWSDPLEFAFKTLRGEISIEDTLRYTSCFNKQVDVPNNQAMNGGLQTNASAPINSQHEFKQPGVGASEQLNTPNNHQVDGFLKSSQHSATVNFQHEFVPHSESLKKHQLPAFPPPPPLPPFSTPGNPSFLTCNAQSNADAGKKDCPQKF